MTQILQADLANGFTDQDIRLVIVMVANELPLSPHKCILTNNKGTFGN